MRLLQVVPYFLPAFAFGGPVKVAYQVSRELVKRKNEVSVYTSDARDFSSRLKINSDNDVDGIRVHYFRNLASMLVKKFRLFITPQLVSRSREEVEKFDVVHLHEYRTFQNVVVAYYAKKYGIPYVLQAHGSLPRVTAKRSLKWVYDALFGYKLLRDASKVIALNWVEADQYRCMGVPDEKIVVIPNGIGLSEYADLPPSGCFKRKFGISDDEKIVLYVGRLHESKGLALLAQAFKIVSKTVSKVRLVVVGPDDGYESAFSRLLSGLRIEEKVLLMGFVEKRDKLAAFVDSDVFVTPCFSGFPVTFLEACLAGCPIVTASDELDWIHENVGYIAKKCPVELAKSISSVIQDELTSEKFKKNCKSIIKKFEISNITSQLENVYRSVEKKSVAQ